MYDTDDSDEKGPVSMRRAALEIPLAAIRDDLCSSGNECILDDPNIPTPSAPTLLQGVRSSEVIAHHRVGLS